MRKLIICTLILFVLGGMLMGCNKIKDDLGKATPPLTELHNIMNRTEAIEYYGNEVMFPINVEMIAFYYDLNSSLLVDEVKYATRYNLLQYNNLHNIDFYCTRNMNDDIVLIVDTLYNYEASEGYFSDNNVIHTVKYIEDLKLVLSHSLNYNGLLIYYKYNDIYYEISFNNLPEEFQLEDIEEYDILDFINDMYQDYKQRNDE